MITPSLLFASNVTDISVSAPVPNVTVFVANVVIGPPSPVVPSWVCPVFAANAASSWSNSSLVSAALIVSPSVYVDCRV